MAAEKPEAFVEIAEVLSAIKDQPLEGLMYVQDFLHRFGYVSHWEALRYGILDDETSEALAKYQTLLGLLS